MFLFLWICLSLPRYLAAVQEDWEQALVHFGLQMPDGVIDANFYRAASRVSDEVAPVEVIQLNPAVSPASALREACLCWPDFITNPPNWRMVGVHVARCQSPNRALHRPTYMVLRRGVDAALELRPHGLIEILGLVPRTINEVFPTVLPERVNRPLILRLLGNLESFCHRSIDCRVWVNGVEIDTHMIMIAHGFYAFVQLQATVGADVVTAAEAASAVVRQGRFYHVPTAPSADVLYCPGGRTLASCRMVLVSNHPDLPGVDHLRAARDQWPDLLGVALQKFHVHHAVREESVVPAAYGCVLLIVPVARDFGTYAIGLTLHFDTWSSHGGVYTQRFIALTFLLQQLDLQGMCANPTISCECFHNGVALLDNPQQVDHGDYVSCWTLTRTLQPSNPQCNDESAEEEPDGEFESNHSPAPKRSVEGHRVSERGAGRTSRGHSVPSLTLIW